MWNLSRIIFAFVLSVCMAFSYAKKEKPSWSFLEGNEYRLCQDIYQELQKYPIRTPEEVEKTMRCMPHVVENYAGFTPLPWGEPLNPQEHLDLLFELDKWGVYGDNYYFNGVKDPQQDDQMLADRISRIPRDLQGMLDQGVQLKLVQIPIRDNIKEYYWFKKDPEFYGKPLNILYIRYPESRLEACDGFPKGDIYWGYTELVNSDLTGPDPRQNRGLEDWYPFREWSVKNYIFFYKGLIHFVNVGYGRVDIKPGSQLLPDGYEEDPVQRCLILLDK